VQKATQSVAGGQHCPYKYRPALQSKIDKYASQRDVAEAAWHFGESWKSKVVLLQCV